MEYTMIKKTHLFKKLNIFSSSLISGILLGAILTTPSLGMEEDKKYASTALARVEDGGLPDENWLKVFSFLTPQSLTYTALVSRHLKTVSEDDVLWKNYGVSSKAGYIKIISELEKKKPYLYTHVYPLDGQDVGLKLALIGTKTVIVAEEQAPFLKALILSFIQRKYGNNRDRVLQFNQIDSEIGKLLPILCKIAFEKNHRYLPRALANHLVIINNIKTSEQEMEEILEKAL